MENILKSVLLGGFVLMASCGPKVERTSGFLPGKKLSELKEKKLKEISGLASSHANPGLLWALNDSGNAAQVFLIDDKCDLRQSIELEGIDNRDWEDIAVGPGPDSSKTYVYVGDIGDNDGTHTLKYIYRFEEPIYNPDDAKQKLNNFDTIIFRLPRSRKMDSEALFIDWKTKDLYIVTKREQPVHVYEITYPYSTKDTIEAKEVAVLPTTQIVAADLSTDGNELIIKNYSHIYYWNNRAGRSLGEWLKEKPEEIPYLPEPQGESLTWSRDDSGFYTISEASKGQPTYLFYYGRK
jgi:hypothetical protein